MLCCRLFDVDSGDSLNKVINNIMTKNIDFQFHCASSVCFYIFGKKVYTNCQYNLHSRSSFYAPTIV